MTGKKLYKIRKALQMSQRGMANFLNISNTAISRYENGDRSIPSEVESRLNELLSHLKKQTHTEKIQCPVCKGIGLIDYAVVQDLA
jgi:transcriptional regulator with XRE-family HTH domain